MSTPKSARRFVWNELADWYLESVKARLDAPGADREVARAVLVHAFDSALRLLHPVVPFVTESLWQRLPGRATGEFLARAAWPARRARGSVARRRRSSSSCAKRFWRFARSAPTTPCAPGKPIEVLMRPLGGGSESPPRAVRAARARRSDDSRGPRCAWSTTAPAGAAAHAVISGGTEIIIPLAGLDRRRQGVRASSRRGGRAREADHVARGTPEQRRSTSSARRSRWWRTTERSSSEMKAKRDQLVDKVRSLCGA